MKAIPTVGKFLLIIGIIVFFLAVITLVFGDSNKLGINSSVNNSSVNNGTNVHHLEHIDWKGHRWTFWYDANTGWLIYPDSVWVDAQDRLHMKYTNQNPTGKWQGIWMVTPDEPNDPLGQQFWEYGDYIWRIEDSSFNFTDPYIIWAAWLHDNYAPPDYNELDFEMTRWGDPDSPNTGSNTIHNGGDLRHYFPLYDTSSTLTIQWHPDNVSFIADSGKDGRQVWGSSDPIRIPTPNKMQVWMGLFLWRKEVPDDGKPIEIIVKDFQFIPYSE